METRRIEEHVFTAEQAADLQEKAAALIDDPNLANFTVTRRDDGGFELTLQLRFSEASNR